MSAEHLAEPTIGDVVGTAIAALAPERIDVAPESDLRDDLGYHSLALVELSFILEDAFELEQISREEAERIRTVRDVWTYIERKVADRGFLYTDGGEQARSVLDNLSQWGDMW